MGYRYYGSYYLPYIVARLGRVGFQCVNGSLG
ncbi:hypothetical protein T12_13591 [Trichinella patagoniensis]|uniref:Uncharacterized protein n=1 Tax=Trichinella patagoniensis TaxID=990121 RepID=A0A0V0UL42_9BILA|nr:hypothetical protein T12_13591 [Trichinella patagoniensis]